MGRAKCLQRPAKNREINSKLAKKGGTLERANEKVIRR